MDAEQCNETVLDTKWNYDMLMNPIYQSLMQYQPVFDRTLPEDENGVKIRKTKYSKTEEW